MKLLNNLLKQLKSKNKEWTKIIAWFRKYKCKDEGMKFIHDSIFKEKYLQSYHMYASMLKMVLYLYRSEVKKDFPYKYSSNRINYISTWFKNNFKLTEGTFNGKPLILEPNQVFKLSLIYGFSKIEEYKKPEEKNKGIIFMVNRLYDTETRKNGKTLFFSALAVFVVLNPFDNDHKPEVYASGPDEKSSKLIYEKARDLAKSNELIRSQFRSIGERVFKTHNNSVIVDLPFKTEALEGRNSSLTILTEVHLHKTEIMINSHESSSNLSRINSLLVFDTTKGEGVFGVAYRKENEYKDITIEQLENIDKNIGVNIATFMAEVDKEDVPDDINNPWETNPLRKSTPMLGKIISLEQLQQQWEIAKRRPVSRREFLIKKFGKWIGNLQSLISVDDLEKCNDKWKNKYKIEDFEGANALIAVDLANTGDTNAVSVIFKTIEDGVEVPMIYSKIFIPKATLEKRIDQERKPYYEWIENDWVRTCGESAIDYKVIAEYINELTAKYKIEKILYDPYSFHIVNTYLERLNGISSVYLDEESKVKQNAATLSSPMEDYLKKIADGDVFFFGNPVFIEHHINMKPQFNSQGQIYWTKEKQEHRVDIFSNAVVGMVKFGDLIEYKKKKQLNMEVWAF